VACPTVISPPWQPPGWQPTSIPANTTYQIVLSGGGVPQGASVAFIQLSVKGTPGDSVTTRDAAGDDYTPCRAQVSNLWNDTLGFAPIDSNNAIYIHNYASASVSVEVKVFGYT